MNSMYCILDKNVACCIAGMYQFQNSNGTQIFTNTIMVSFASTKKSRRGYWRISTTIRYNNFKDVDMILHGPSIRGTS